MNGILVNAVLQLIGGLLFGLGVLGGKQVDQLRSVASNGIARTFRWFNWFPEYLSPRPSPLRMFFQHFCVGGGLLMLIGLFVFVGGPQKGWSWLTANVAVLMLAVAIAIAVVTKLRFLRSYELDVPGRRHELPRTAVDRTVWLLTSPTVTALTVSLLIVFLWQLRGWKSNEALLYAMVSYFSLSLSIFLAGTVQWALAQNVVGRLALVLFGVAFYVAGTLAATP